MIYFSRLKNIFVMIFYFVFTLNNGPNMALDKYFRNTGKVISGSHGKRLTLPDK